MSTKVYIAQQEAGEDGLFHWKLVVAPAGDIAQAIWYDVIWSDDKDVGMELRGPSKWIAAKSRRQLGLHLLGSTAPENETTIEHVCKDTKRPKYTVEDKDKNCQTWLEEVVEELVKKDVLSKDALTKLNAVPKRE